MTVLKDPGRIEIVGRDKLESRLQQGGPNIGVTLHMGNWELAAWACALCGGKLAGVYRPLENAYLDRMLRNQRQQLYSGGLFTKAKSHTSGLGGHRTAHLILDYARQGGNLGFVCDEIDRRGLTVPFFGKMAKFTPVPSMIARHVGARLWMARRLRIGSKTRFRIELQELKIRRTTDREDDIRASTSAIFRQFESWIRDAPEQWMWWNTRWVSKSATPSQESAGPNPSVSTLYVTQTVQ